MCIARGSSYTEVTVNESTGYGAGVERSCVGSIVSWVTDWLPASLLLTNRSSNAPEQFHRESSSNRREHAVDVVDPETEWDDGNPSQQIHHSHQQQQQQQRRFFGEMVLPGSDETDHEFDLNQLRQQHNKQQQNELFDAVVHDSIQVLNSYYDALNQQDLFAAVTMLDEDVLVLFPEDSRNWSGAETAVGKFRNMFNSLPGFQGSITITNWKHEVDDSVSIYARCHFQCIQTRYNAERDMMYGVKDNKIFLIDHKV